MQQNPLLPCVQVQRMDPIKICAGLRYHFRAFWPIIVIGRLASIGSLVAKTIDYAALKIQYMLHDQDTPEIRSFVGRDCSLQ